MQCVTSVREWKRGQCRPIRPGSLAVHANIRLYKQHYAHQCAAPIQAKVLPCIIQRRCKRASSDCALRVHRESIKGQTILYEGENLCSQCCSLDVKEKEHIRSLRTSHDRKPGLSAHDSVAGSLCENREPMHGMMGGS